ncbi:UNVERIFIED_CONTAM: hypothetical protein Sindi_1831200 [Sesamum indicum]
MGPNVGNLRLLDIFWENDRIITTSSNMLTRSGRHYERGPVAVPRAADSTSKVGTGDDHEKVAAYTSACLDQITASSDGILDEAQHLVSSDRQNELYLLLEHCCRIVYAKAAKLEQIMLQQRAKMQWMKDGDQCSRVFFHKIAQRRNLLGGTKRRWTVNIQYLRPWARHCITDEEANHLLLPFSPDDVKKAVFDIAEDKAPELDGYSSGFFKAAWPVVGEEVKRAY